MHKNVDLNLIPTVFNTFGTREAWVPGAKIQKGTMDILRRLLDVKITRTLKESL